MSMLFKQKRTIRKGNRPPYRPPITPKTIKYQELYGKVEALAANKETFIIDYEVPTKHGAELYAIGAKMDLAMGTAQKKTKELEIWQDDHPSELKFGVSNYIFGASTGCLGWGNNRVPLLQLDYPMQRGSLTPKFSGGQRIRIRLVSDEIAIDKKIQVRAKVLLYPPADCARIYGATPDNFATVLPGGVNHPSERLFADYAYCKASDGLGDVKWEDLYSRLITKYELIQLTHLGLRLTGGEIGATHFKDLRIYDMMKKVEFPEYSPWWTIDPEANPFSIGGDVAYVPITKLPKTIFDHVFNTTTMKVQFHDDETAVAAYDAAVQLLGKYKQKRI